MTPRIILQIRFRYVFNPMEHKLCAAFSFSSRIYRSCALLMMLLLLTVNGQAIIPHNSEHVCCPITMCDVTRVNRFTRHVRVRLTDPVFVHVVDDVRLNVRVLHRRPKCS